MLSSLRINSLERVIVTSGGSVGVCEAPENFLQVCGGCVIKGLCDDGAASRMAKESAEASVDEDAKGMSSVLGSPNGIQVCSELATSIPCIHRVAFKWRVWVVAVGFIDVSILELNVSFHIVRTGNARARGGGLRVAGNIRLGLPSQEGCGIGVGGG
jgi:hypothetical protein